METLKTITYLTFIFFLSSCVGSTTETSIRSNSVKEVKRISSPDKKVDAVLTETEGGATVANSNRVFIVLPGRKVSEDDLRLSLFTADHTRNLSIEWKQKQQLLIKYDKARIFNFINSWHSGEVDNWNYVVELTLQCTSPDGQLSEIDKHPMSN